MTIKRLYTTALIAAGLTLTACAQNTSKDNMESPATLTAYHWQMERAVDASGNDSPWSRPANNAIRASLRFSDKHVGIVGLCNAMGADYTLKGSHITISPVMGTMKMCHDEALMRYEQNVAQRLAGTSTWQINQSQENPRLTLKFDDGSQWTLKGEPTPETRYGGTGETVFLEVAPQTKPCSHPEIGNFQCLQVRTVSYDGQGLKQGHGEWQNFYDKIENYEHTPGIRNILRVTRYTNKNAPADASTYVYILDNIVESEHLQ